MTEGEKSEVAVATGGASRVKGPCRERGAGGGSLLSRLEAGAPGAHMAVPLVATSLFEEGMATHSSILVWRIP